ncbi:SCO family protein [Reichenbachiella carrageenanivorans]|uniref:SCO family protein n=1 Tax=Reichenbachiella carrageenanivorans TaxID=2979869 RepID=A0ABY6CVM3_9BACT|nr:SCO family protein [Reichenbachiella carrageenanivorans]UXX77918.1 SCO family protein [Reichenbachiella carrageenanivorans]
MKNHMWACAMVLTILGCSQPQKKRMNDELVLPYYSEATFTPEWITVDDPRYKTIHQVEDFAFVNQVGDTLSNEYFDGKIYVTNFFFTICPNVCPRMTKNLKKIQAEFASDQEVKILSHTVMPWVDSVGRLAEYASLNDIDSQQWQLVTGDKKDLYHMAREAYFADEGFGKTVTVEEDFLHTENIILIDTQRRIRGVYNGTLPLEMKRLIEDIYTLKKEV